MILGGAWKDGDTVANGWEDEPGGDNGAMTAPELRRWFTQGSAFDPYSDYGNYMTAQVGHGVGICGSLGWGFALDLRPPGVRLAAGSSS